MDKEADAFYSKLDWIQIVKSIGALKQQVAEISNFYQNIQQFAERNHPEADRVEINSLKVLMKK